MAALEIEGKIQQKLAPQKGQSARGTWTKQDFILEYQDGNFPASVCFTSFGDEKVAELDRFQVGDSVKVSFNLRAREFNGRWYNDFRAVAVNQPTATVPPVGVATGVVPPAGATQPTANAAQVSDPDPLSGGFDKSLPWEK